MIGSLLLGLWFIPLLSPAQNLQKLTGKVWSPYKEPLRGAVVSVPGSSESTETDSLGRFTLEIPDLKGYVEVWSPGCYLSRQAIMDRSYMEIRMIAGNKYNYNTDLLKPPGIENSDNKSTSAANIGKKDLNEGSLSLDQAFYNAIPGLRMMSFGGMPGEGSYINARGLNSFFGNSSPLIVINNVPYMPDKTESYVIGGFTGNILGALNPNDIQNITYLRGADAAIYGSLGSNGVILIQTDDAVDLDTKVEFIGQYGMAYNTATLPVMGVSDYKIYLGNIGLTKYDDPAGVLNLFPFLKDDPDYYYNYLYNNRTDWQDMIYDDAFLTDNIIKIKGGDAIAKYDLSLGFMRRNGVIKETDLSRYHMRLNANVNVSKKVDMFASASMAYLTNNLQEQGMSKATNPMLAAYAKSPLLAPYKQDQYGTFLPDYAPIRNSDNEINENNAVTNPLALVNTAELSSDAYDILINAGLNYHPAPYWTLTGMGGFYYNYNRMEAFIPGVSGKAIMPLSDNLADNTVRMGIKESFNMYYNLNAKWKRTFDKIHAINTSFGWQAKTTRREFDSGEGRNTASDFYKTLSNVNSVGRNFFGYINLWNWMNFYGRAEYTFNNLLTAGINFSVDGASSSGENAARFYFYPSVNLAWNIKNMSFLRDSRFIDQFRLRTEYVMTGNSDFSSILSRYYYQTQQFQQLSGIVRAGISNTGLKPEKTGTFNAGIDLAAFNNMLDLTVDAYRKNTSGMIFPKSINTYSGAAFVYENMAEVRNQGMEIGLQSYIIRNKTFYWLLGGTTAFNKNEIISLGGEKDYIIELPDGSSLINKVGESMYNLYGYKTDGVYASTAEAEAAGMTNYAGVPFKAGDVRFVNLNNNDRIIDNNDRTVLGNAGPDFFGRFYTSIGYRNIVLTANFSYSCGNEAYNAVRREYESMSTFDNQLTSVVRRWQREGQQTDMPVAVYGDPMENSRFSDRWIEDASFIKLKELTLSYHFNKDFIRFLQGGTFYISGENLFTVTGYLGPDPEFSYSYSPMLQGFDYGKVAHPLNVKLGVKLQF
jgi:TonB-linked SusC/RagA family outer membrane protein